MCKQAFVVAQFTHNNSQMQIAAENETVMQQLFALLNTAYVYVNVYSVRCCPISAKHIAECANCEDASLLASIYAEKAYIAA